MTAPAPTVRADRVAGALGEAEPALDALLVSSLVNVRWLTAFTGSSAAVVGGAATARAGS